MNTFFETDYFEVALGAGGFCGPAERTIATGFLVFPFICPNDSRFV